MEKYIDAFTMIYRRRVGAYGIENKEMMESFKDWDHLINQDPSLSIIERLQYSLENVKYGFQSFDQTCEILRQNLMV